jgi:hypothetical protein
VLVAGESIDQALQLMLRTHGDFNISNAESLDMIALLSGSPWTKCELEPALS